MYDDLFVNLLNFAGLSPLMLAADRGTRHLLTYFSTNSGPFLGEFVLSVSFFFLHLCQKKIWG